jgi:hypothetical protein
MNMDEYIENAQGDLVKRSNVREVDLLRDALVCELFAHGAEVAAQVAAFKGKAYADIVAFADLSAEKYGVKRGGKKGNISLSTFDGRYKIELARQDKLQFTEQLAAAQALILECFAEWTEGTRDEVRLLIDQAFRTNKAGQVSTEKVLGLLRLEIKHPKWDLAMQAIRDSVMVAGTASYIRLYRREGAAGKYRLIALDGAEAGGECGVRSAECGVEEDADAWNVDPFSNPLPEGERE